MSSHPRRHPRTQGPTRADPALSPAYYHLHSSVRSEPARVSHPFQTIPGDCVQSSRMYSSSIVPVSTRAHTLACAFLILQAVKELSVAFKPYITVDRVASMYKTVQERQNQCRGLVTEEFESL